MVIIAARSLSSALSSPITPNKFASRESYQDGAPSTYCIHYHDTSNLYFSPSVHVVAGVVLSPMTLRRLDALAFVHTPNASSKHLTPESYGMFLE